jgi:transposase
MDERILRHEREQAIHLIRSGRKVKEVAEILHRSEQWVRKWRRRYEAEGWEGLNSRSRRPHHLTRRLPERVRKAVIEARSQLEASAGKGELKFIGSSAVRTRLKEKGVTPLPSTRTIERILTEAHMTRPYHKVKGNESERYPHLQPSDAQVLIQVDIYPRHLKGGQSVFCFNAIDVVSRYPVSKAYAHRRSVDAVDFLQAVLKEAGVPRYIQMDNEGCFSGGTTHPGVIGKTVRAALMAGVEPVFSPVRHPKSQGTVERFHRTYGRHVWEDTFLKDIDQVNREGRTFIHRYVRRPHPRLGDKTPLQVHRASKGRRLPATFSLPEDLTKSRLPIYEGKVHFMRKVDQEGKVRFLNKDWKVPGAAIGQGVWCTLTLVPKDSFVEIFDGAPDASERSRFVRYPFTLSEPVLPLPSPRKPLLDRVASRLSGMASKVRNDVLAVMRDVKVPKFETMS